MNVTNELNTSAKPSRLLTAALAGLMAGGLVACSNDKEDQAPTALITPMESANKIISTKPIPGLTFATFSSDCKTRGGLVQTHATCGGTNSCKGMSYNKYSQKMIEHSCSASNSCGGMSCVELPKDTGALAEELYSKSCGECHGVADEATKTKDPTAFKVFAAPGADLKKAEDSFRMKSLEAQVAIVAFGKHGVNANGTSYSNMPAFYEKLSRAEIERVVAHLRALTPRAEEYTVFGENLGL
ncbi:MAG: c-type cytochrome [Oligoflexus sp.]|nr:c-type cytochrome [Oligoflexus sp.]